MKLLLISDLHLTSITPIARKDNVLKTGLGKLRYVLEYAKKHNCTILEAGDFADKSRDWNLLYELHKLLKKYNVPILAIQGQHDYYYRSKLGNNASTMGVLEQSGLVKILLRPEYLDIPESCSALHPPWKIYPVNWDEDVTIEKDTFNNTILLAHAPISPIRVHPRQKVTTTKEFKKLHENWDLVLLGDIHRWFESGKGDKNNTTYIVNTGPMMRLEATEYNMTHKPCFYIFDTNTRQLIRKIIPHEPSDKVLDTAHIKPETEKEYDEDRINELATAMQQTFKDDPQKKKLAEILTKKKVSKSVRKIIVDVYNKVMEKK